MTIGGRRGVRRRVLASGIALLAVLAGGPPVVTGPAWAANEEARFVALTNGARRDDGRRPYAVAYDLVAVARRHAQQMARRHYVFHNSRLGSEVSNWRAVGENVGRGPSVESIHEALMDSPSHRANILDRDFTQVGIGTAHDEKGVLYVTEVFRQPMPAPPVLRTRTKPSVRVEPPPRRRVMPRPGARGVLRRKLAAAQAIVAKERPDQSFERVLTYVKVMQSLV